MRCVWTGEATFGPVQDIGAYRSQYLGTFAGKYCVACEEYYADDELVTFDGTADCCPIHQRPVEYFEEENWFFRLSRYRDAVLDLINDNYFN